MAQEEVLCISYFDTIIGPNLFYCNENLSDDEDHPDLGRILEFNEEEGTFIFAFRKFQTINHIFYIPNDNARGGIDNVMVTYMIRASYFKSEIQDVFEYLESKTPILEKFAKKVTNFNGFSALLHSKKSINSTSGLLKLADDKFKVEFLDLYNEIFDELSFKYPQDMNINTPPELKKIFVFGAEEVGKNTFLRNLEDIQFHNQETQNLPSKIFEIIIDNIEIIYEDCESNNFKCEQCGRDNRCINNAQGYILIFNASNRQSLIETLERYKIIINRFCKLNTESNIPILIIGNKFQYNEDVDDIIVLESFKNKIPKDCALKIKYFVVDLIHDEDKTMEALRWLVKEII